MTDNTYRPWTANDEPSYRACVRLNESLGDKSVHGSPPGDDLEDGPLHPAQASAHAVSVASLRAEPGRVAYSGWLAANPRTTKRAIRMRGMKAAAKTTKATPVSTQSLRPNRSWVMTPATEPTPKPMMTAVEYAAYASDARTSRCMRRVWPRGRAVGWRAINTPEDPADLVGKIAP
jgi:hypothetical protein